MKKLCVIICSALFIVSIITGIRTKLSFTNLLAENPNFKKFYVTNSLNENLEEFKRDLNDFSKELDMADFVAKVKFTGEREFAYKSVLSTALVLDVFVGDTKLIGKDVYIYEDNYFDLKIKAYRNISHANLMTAGDEYLIFGTNTTNIYSKHPKIKFAPASFQLSLFRLKENNDNLLSEKDISSGIVKYDHISKNEFICCNQKQLKLLLNFKNKYLKKYNIQL